jgi:predicted MFS family arabinose efflux permease
MIPFFVMAGIFALFIYPTYSLLPPDDDKSVARKKAPMGAALKNNVVLISFIVLIWQTTGLAYYSVLLSKHIMAYGFKESMTGYLLTC